MSDVDWIAGRGGPLHGQVRVPGDKSVSHRAVMLGAIAEGTSRITGFLEGEDTRATAAVLAKLGVRIEAPAPSERLIYGVGLHGLAGSDEPLDCGNAGTGMRLLAGLLAGQRFDSTLVGDESLSRRPMRRVIAPLEAMGARISAAPGALPPLRIHGNNVLKAIDFTTEVASAQVKSAVLLAGLYAAGTTIVREPHPTRDYTEQMLRAFGVDVDFREGFAAVRGGQRLQPCQVEVPPDFSSAAFPLVAACLVPGSDIEFPSVGLNPRRTGLLEALRAMGADIEVSRAGADCGQVRVRHARLRGIEVPTALVPDMIDEFPILFVAAALAEGTTVVRGAAELRVKESDRIAAMAAALRALGARIEETPDGAVIHGGTLTGGVVDSHGDHRIAMAMAVAAQLASAPVRIGDCANVATSFPRFVDLSKRCGMNLVEA